jgi:hypothetical protein
MELGKKLAQLGNLSNGVGDCSILSFGTRAGDCSLSLRRPRDEIVAKEDGIAGGRLAGVRTAGPICI